VTAAQAITGPLALSRVGNILPRWSERPEALPGGAPVEVGTAVRTLTRRAGRRASILPATCVRA